MWKLAMFYYKWNKFVEYNTFYIQHYTLIEYNILYFQEIASFLLSAVARSGIHHESFSSVQFSHSVVTNSLWPHEQQHTRPPCPSPTPGIHPNPCPLSQWCHPTILSSVVPFSSCPQSFPASGSFQISQLFASGGQIIGVSASTSVLPMNTQDWSPLGWMVGFPCSPGTFKSLLQHHS